MEQIPFSIRVKNLSKKFGNILAIDNVSFTVKQGSLHGFIGPNGAGKTSTIKCLIGAIIPNSGSILIENHDFNSLEAKKMIGYIPEKATFPKGISTYSFLVSMAQISGINKKQAIAMIETKLKTYELWELRKKSPLSYSSGMKKKVLLIQSLINDPQILIMDEPAANLDPTVRTMLYKELKKLTLEGKTIFISSHILAELQNIVDEVTILNKGKVVYSGLLNNQTDIKYQINSTDNLSLLKLLKQNHYFASDDSKNIVIKIEDKSQINQIYQIAIENKITILSMELQETNLQKLYEEMVIKPTERSEQ